MKSSDAKANLEIAELDLRFHHLGVATHKVAREKSIWLSIGYRLEGETFIDPVQGVSGVFLTGPGPRLELLENLPGRTTLESWLERGIKIYHQAFEVADLERSISLLMGLGAKVIVAPVQAVAFGGRRIAFLMLPTLALIELIERESKW